MEDPKRILLGKASTGSLDRLNLILDQLGVEVIRAVTGHQMLEILKDRPVDLILLDSRLPAPDGIEVCRLVSQSYRAPIILLTARGEPQEIIDGFLAGAEDCIAYPLREWECIARIWTVLMRRAIQSRSPRQVHRYGDLVLDVNSRKLLKRDTLIQISPIEYKLMHFFMLHIGEVISKDTLLRQVWSHQDISGDINLVDSALKRLRNKIEDDAKNPRYFFTIWGAGIQFGLLNIPAPG